MKKIYFKRFIVLVLVLAAAVWQTLLAAPTNRELLFDEGWLFFRGAALGADKTDYQDDFWRKLDLPHDWSIEDLPNTQSPFDRGALSQVNGGFTTGGTGWYRKHFTMPKQATGNKVIIQFDGVYMNADFYLNGKKLGNHPYGYTSFYFDITNHLRFDTVNVMAVKVANEGVNSRWYSGSGIYRHVWLKTMPAVHLAQWGTYITTPQVSEASAQVNVETKVTNNTSTVQRVKLVTHLQNANGFKAAQLESEATIAAGQTHVFAKSTAIQNPQRWSIESPSLYTAVNQVFINGVQVDEDETAFGIRSISFDAKNGFRLNGKTVKLKGGCVHNDNGALGAKAFDAAEERKVAVLKASGFNAIRTSHNPPSAEFLDACDRLGMLVIDEAFDCWEQKKNANDYHLYFKEWWQRDIESLLLRDRNHPSIIMWSTGNEIPNRDKPEVAAVSKKLTEYIKQFDTTRPVTCGVNGVDETKDLFFSTMDVAGYNYAPKQYVPDHLRKPDRVMYGSESFSRYAFEYWMAVEDNPYVIGDFVWTAYDYIGEASIGWLGYPQRQHFFPWNLAYCGDIDVCGWKRPQSYYRDVLWMPNQLSFFVKSPKPTFDTATFKKELWAEWDYKDLQPHWTWPGNENQPLEVDVYSSCDEVELFLNNKSLGKKKTNRASRFTATYQVPYVKGELKVLGFTNKKLVETRNMRTAGEAVKLIATVEKSSLAANGQDLAYINFEIVDEAGVRIPTAAHLLQFECSGSGSLIAVANANPTSIESFSLPQRKAWQGRAQAVVKAGKTPGNILLKVFAENLPPVYVVLQVK